jgi:hypothetical protein
MSLRLPVLLAVVLAIVLWLVGDEFAQRSRELNKEIASMQTELGRLANLKNQAELQNSLQAAQRQSAALREAAHSGPTLMSARAQLAGTFQALVSQTEGGSSNFRFTRSQSSSASAGAAAGATGEKAELADGFVAEPFSIGGTFAPLTFMQLLRAIQDSPHLIRVEGLSVKGSRFEVLGNAVLQAQPPQGASTKPGSAAVKP